MIWVRPNRPEDRQATAGVFFRAVREGSAAVYSKAQRMDRAKSPEPDWTKSDPLRARHFSRRFLEKRGWKVDEVEDFISPGGVSYERFLMSLNLAH